MRHDMAEMDPLFEMVPTRHAIVDASQVANVVDWYLIGIHSGNRSTPTHSSWHSGFLFHSHSFLFTKI